VTTLNRCKADCLSDLICRNTIDAGRRSYGVELQGLADLSADGFGG